MEHERKVSLVDGRYLLPLHYIGERFWSQRIAAIPQTDFHYNIDV